MTQVAIAHLPDIFHTFVSPAFKYSRRLSWHEKCMRQNAFVGRARLGPTEGAYRLCFLRFPRCINKV